MTKQEFQKELLEKVKPGVKASVLKKLKRSKSTGDIPKAPLPKSTPLVKSKSAQELEPNSKIEELGTKISVLELKLETKERELVEKDIENNSLKEQIAKTNQQLKELAEFAQSSSKQTELDQNLTKRHQNLKDWFKQYQKSKKLDAELSENIEQASEELVNQDQTIAKLRSENNRLKQSNSRLEKDLKLSQRLAELRRNSPLTSESGWLPTPSFNWITLVLTLFALWIWIKQPHYD